MSEGSFGESVVGTVYHELVLVLWSEIPGRGAFTAERTDTGVMIVGETSADWRCNFERNTATNSVHVWEVLNACNHHIPRSTRNVRRVLSDETAQIIIIACSIVASGLDYCNVILYEDPLSPLVELHGAKTYQVSKPARQTVVAEPSEAVSHGAHSVISSVRDCGSRTELITLRWTPPGLASQP